VSTSTSQVSTGRPRSAPTTACSPVTITELTEGMGVDVTIDMVGNDATLVLPAAVTRSLGHLSIVGIGGGTLPIGFFSIAYEVSVATTYWGASPS
jgi:alcohol dehydrogenase, propanol-preferring